MTVIFSSRFEFLSFLNSKIIWKTHKLTAAMPSMISDDFYKYQMLKFGLCCMDKNLKWAEIKCVTMCYFF